MKIFLDDERFPATDDFDCIVRTYEEFVGVLINSKIEGRKISFISFDHDLGLGKTGYDCAKFFVDCLLDNLIDLDEKFNFYVHSMNPIGASSIRNYLTKALETIQV